MNYTNKILQGDALEVLRTLPEESIDCVVTSPPYWALRDYGVAGQLGLERTPKEFIARLCDIFDEVRRVLKKTGNCFVNINDTYFGGGRNKGNIHPKMESKQVRGLKNIGDTLPGPKGGHGMAQIPARFELEMTARGWIKWNTVIWHKPNAMPSSAQNRFTVDFEDIFFFTKSKKHYFETQFEEFRSNDYDRARMARGRTEYGGKWAQESGGAIKTQRAFVAGHKEGRNKRCVWSINTYPSIIAQGRHYATYPPDLCRTPILAGCPKDGVVLDPFSGTGTTAVVAKKLGRKFVGIELNPEYIKLAQARVDSILI